MFGLLKKYFSNYSFLVTIVVFSMILVSIQSVLAQESEVLSDFSVGIPDHDRTESFSSLTSMANEQGTIRVIVGLDIPFTATGINGTEKDLSIQMNAISVAQMVLLEEISESRKSIGLSPSEISETFSPTNFRYIPFIGLIVDAETLELMQESSLVSSIVEDIAVFPLLKDSIPFIGADKVWAKGFTGQGQTIAILDTGVDRNHDMLSGKVVEEACYSSSGFGVESLCPNGSSQQLGVGAAAPCDSICQHGTHVASTAAGNEMFSGPTAYAGVARDADIIGIQVFSKFNDPVQCSPRVAPCVKAYTSDILEGLERVIDLRDSHDIAAVNLSLGGGKYLSPCDSQPYRQAIDELRSYGIATIASSGNDGFFNGIGSPACISSAISVGATDNNDVIRSFSNSASFLDLLAPGFDIRAAIPSTTSTSVLGFKSGTSMAAPHVAGAWAVLKSNSPGATIDEILNVLQDNGVTITDSRNSLDFKRIDLDASLCALDPSTCTIPPPPTTVPDAPTGLNAVSSESAQVPLSWTAPTNNGGSPITDYLVEFSSDAGATWTTFAHGDDTTTETVTGLTNDQPYSFRVSAINAVGTSIVSNIDNATPGDCLIATAAYGSALAPQVQFLREIRDNTVLSTTSGTTFMTGFNAVYYSFAPTVANWERENPMFQEVVRVFITPMISSLSIMSLADSGSEVEVIGLGISVIALNLGMYIAAPALIGFQIHKHIKLRKNSDQ